jgi:thioredoxin 1
VGPRYVTDATFEEEVVRSSVPVVVDFTANWCRPCRASEPTLRELADKLSGRVKFATVDVDEAAGVTRSYGIQALPTFLFVQFGREKARTVGPIDPVALRVILARHFAFADPAPAPSGGRPANR